jgi:hypothetical protein
VAITPGSLSKSASTHQKQPPARMAVRNRRRLRRGAAAQQGGQQGGQQGVADTHQVRSAGSLSARGTNCSARPLLQ